MLYLCSDKLHYEKFVDGSVICIEDEIPFEIPDSWEWVRLGTIGEWGSGATPSRTNSKYYGGNIPWLKTGDLNDGYIKNIPENITDLALKEASVKLNPSNSVLIAMYGATIGKLGILTFPATTNQACCACLPIVINNKYLFYFLMAQKQNFIKRGEGGAQPNISKEKIVATIMPLPPLAEQQRIVETVENLLQLVDKIEEDKVDLEELINQTKSKVLDLAIKGKLVSQDPNDEPADKLLERIREEKEKLIKEGKLKRDKNETFIFKNSDDNSYYEQINGEAVCINDDLPFEIPDSWRWCRLKDIGTIIGGGTPKTNIKENWENGNIPWLTPADMKNIKGKYVKGGERNITIHGYNSSSTVMLLPNSIVYSSRAPIGYTAITQNSLCTNQGFKSVDLYYKESANYIYYLLKAITTDIINRASGTTFKEISGSEFGQTFVPLPPIKEQIEIGEYIDNIFQYLDNLETIIKGS